MPHLENDMDDLFQRAAENYPLRKEKGDWESVAKKIADTSMPVTVAPSGNKKNRKWIALVLILFILFSGWQGYQVFNDSKSSRYDGNEFTKGIDKRPTQQESEENNDNVFRDEKNVNTAPGINKNNNNSNNIAISPANKSSQLRSAEANNFYRPKPFSENSDDAELQNSQFNKVSKTERYTTDWQKLPGYSPGEILNKTKDITGGQLVKAAGRNLELNNSLKQMENTPGNDKIQDNNNAKTPFLQKKKGVYIGLVAGPDFSKVKEKSFSNTGFKGGMLLGFRLNSRLSFESGIFYDKKYYNSEGKEFSMEKVGATMPTGMIVNDLRSQTALIEIPLKIKYDFSSKKNSGLFITGGVSSYIVTTEKNMYNVTYNGTQQKMEGTYNTKDYGFPAVANLSFGYEQNISRDLNIRIEPYLNIPLQGMGVGSLPVTSAGLHIGFTGRLK